MAEALRGSLEGMARSDGAEASATPIRSVDGSRGFLGDGGLILVSDYRTTGVIGYTPTTPASTPLHTWSPTATRHIEAGAPNWLQEELPQDILTHLEGIWRTPRKEVE